MTAASGPHRRPGGPAFADASPADVRAALVAEEAAEFERDWRAALDTATASLDLTEVFETLDAWRVVAALTAAAGPAGHREMYRRAAARLTGRDVPPGEPLARTKARLGLL